MHILPKFQIILCVSTLVVQAYYDRQQACRRICGRPLSTLEPKPKGGGVKGRFGEKIGASVGGSIGITVGLEAQYATNETEYVEHESKIFNADGGYNKTEHRLDWGHETVTSPYGSFSVILGGGVHVGYGGRRRRRRRSVKMGRRIFGK